MARLPLRNDVPFCTASEAAEHLLCIARDRDTPINHRQLQNLLYYAQGYSLSLGESLLFDDVVEVGEQGPVVRVVEDAYACHGTRSIPVSDDLQPPRRAVMPGLILENVHSVVMDSEAHELFGRLKSETAWRRSCANDRVADPRWVARWWADRIEHQRSRRKHVRQVKWSEYLKQRPDIAERLTRHYEPHELIPWR